MRMWTLIPLVAIVALAAGCGDQPPEPRVSSTPPAGNAAAGSTSAPASDRAPLPASPQATKSAQEKPDPGDANDHSSPRHDARSKKNGD